MKVIPVLDLRGGVVVRGIAGRRHEYRPITSRLTSSTMPADVANAFRDHFGFNEVYVADLDAIAGAARARAIYQDLITLGFDLLVDAGVRDCADAVPLASLGVKGIVAGLETLSGPDALDQLTRALGDRLVFSLDLKEGRSIAKNAEWGLQGPLEIAGQAFQAGVRRLIVLDLARVGVNDGTGTEGLCSELALKYPGHSIIAGGGVRGIEDLLRLRKCGVDGALVASALHDGRLTRADLQIFLRPGECGAAT